MANKIILDVVEEKYPPVGTVGVAVSSGVGTG